MTNRDLLEMEATEYALLSGEKPKNCLLCGAPLVPFAYNREFRTAARTCLNSKCQSLETIINYVMGAPSGRHCKVCQSSTYFIQVRRHGDDQFHFKACTICTKKYCSNFRSIIT